MKSRCTKMSAPILKLMGLAVIPLAMPIAFSTTALAAKRTKAAAAKEVYAATDANEMQPGEANFAMPVDSEQGAVLTAPVASTPATKKAPTAPAASAKSAKSSKTSQAQTAKAPAATAKRAVAAATPAAAPKATPAAAAAPAKAAQSARLAVATYDTVPASQSDALIQRLKIVENLIRKYGRAYDYRTHTLKELELIQSTLESAAAPATPAPINAAPSETDEPQAESDTNQAGQAATAEENAEDVNLSALPPRADFTTDNAAQEN
jgi:hypothetical protein